MQYFASGKASWVTSRTTYRSWKSDFIAHVLEVFSKNEQIVGFNN